MKISNFNLIEVIGTSPMDWKFRATIDITTGFLKEKTTTREIFREYGNPWFFTDTGKFAPNDRIQELVSVFESKLGRKIERIKIGDIHA